MKLYRTLFLGVLFFAFSAQSQVNPHAIGLRFNGGHYGGGHYGAEISYQHGFGESNRLELDLGWRSHRWWSQMAITGIYHWVWNITGGLNWYIGPGAQLGFYRDRGYYNDVDDHISLAIGGQIGIEYDFSKHDVPLQLSLDARPMWDIFWRYDDNGAFGYGAAFSLRYIF
ncbi:MAG: hypothetical protein WDZ35_12975 [Crocinitomicaceae bacterium]